MSGKGFLAAAIVALALAPYAISLGHPPLWDANEPLYAEPPREVLENGDVLAPTWNGRPWFVHPPLSTWVTVPFYAWLGVSPFSERLPMALAAIATILAAASIARRVHGPRAGIVAALVLAATPRFWLYSRQLAGDVYLTACLTGAFALALPAVAEAGTGRRRVLGAHALAGLATLAKGPVALVLYALPLWLVARFGRPRRSIWPLRPWAGLFLVAAIALPWFAYMSARFWPDFPRTYFGWHNLRRAFTEDVGSRPPWFYLQALLGDAQPWTFLIPLAVVRARRAAERRPDQLLPWFASAVPFVLFSLAVGKRNVYLLPIYPMLAVVLAPLLLEGYDGARPRLSRWAAGLAAFALAGGGVVVVLAGRNVPGLADAAIPPAVACFAGAAACLAAAVRGSGRLAVAALLAATLAVEAAAAVSMPALSRYRPVPRLAEALVREAAPGDAAVVYGVSIHSLMYYARRETKVASNPAEVHAAIPPGKRAFVLCQEDEAGPIRDDPRLVVREVDRAPYLVFKFDRTVLGRGDTVENLLLLQVALR